MPPLTTTEFAAQSKKWPAQFFTIKELFDSELAKKHKIQNIPTIDQFWNIAKFAETVLDPIREQWGFPLKISSGFRTPAVNALAGGSPTSEHLAHNGAAADIDFPPGNLTITKQLYRHIYKMARIAIAMDDHEAAKFQFDQIILY